MCYRASLSGAHALNPSPVQALEANLLDTDKVDFGKADGMLEIRRNAAAGIKQRYVSLISRRDRVGVAAFLEWVGGQFFYGSAGLEKPAITTVIYLPAERVSQAAACLQKMADLVGDWVV